MVLMALVAAAVVTTAVAPAPAGAATQPTVVLAQGAGMGAKPSVAVRRVQRVLAQPRLQPRANRESRTLRPVDRRRCPAVPGGPRAGSRRHRRPADRQGRQPDPAQPAAAASARRTGSRTKKSTLPKLVTTERRRRRRPRRPRPTMTGGRAPARLVVIALAAAVAAFCVAIAASVLRRPGRRRARRARPSRRSHMSSILEGHSADEGVADFRGPAIATSVTSEPGHPGEDPGRRGTSSMMRARARRCGSARKRSSAHRRAWRPVSR